MRIYSEEQLFALKTICGGIFYDLSRYNKKEIWSDAWIQLSSHLQIDKSTIYSIEEVTSSTFLFTSKTLSFRYHHDDWHCGRVIELIPVMNKA